MSDLKHTPGPWRWVEPSGFDGKPCEDGTGLSALVTERGEVLCWFGDDCDYGQSAGFEPSDDNAHLIAAAPDLLEALKGLLPHISQELEDRKYGGNDEGWAELERCEAAAIAAVAKAENAHD